MENVTIKLKYEEAEKISQAIYNLFISNYYDVSEALEEIYDFDSIQELCHILINLKGAIDIELNNSYNSDF